MIYLDKDVRETLVQFPIEQAEIFNQDELAFVLLRLCNDYVKDSDNHTLFEVLGALSLVEMELKNLHAALQIRQAEFINGEL